MTEVEPRRAEQVIKQAPAIIGARRWLGGEGVVDGLDGPWQVLPGDWLLVTEWGEIFPVSDEQYQREYMK